MMKWGSTFLLLTFILSLSTATLSVDAKGKHKNENPPAAPYTARFLDYTGVWRETTAQAVGDVNAILSPYGVTVNYEPQGVTPCSGIVPAEDVVTICESGDDHGPDIAGIGSGNWIKTGHGYALQGLVQIDLPTLPGYPFTPKWLLCHEFGHVFWLTHVDADIDSCMTTSGPYFYRRASWSDFDVKRIVSFLPTITPEKHAKKKHTKHGNHKKKHHR